MLSRWSKVSVQHVRDDFHIAMSVRTEALAGFDAVVIDHAQRTKAHVARIVVIREGERDNRNPANLDSNGRVRRFCVT
jgi:hypothetical protein